VIHTIGWPLRSAAKYREFGGSFMYPMGEDKVSVGFVVGLDYRGATLSVHDLLQEFKTHSTMELSGGRFPGGHWPTADDAEVGVHRRSSQAISEAGPQPDLRQAGQRVPVG